MMSDTSRSPAAGCRMAPTSGRCASPTELDDLTQPQPANLNWLGREHDPAASVIRFGTLWFRTLWFRTWPAGAVACERGKRGRVAGAQGRAVGNEGAAHRFVGARHDDAALH